MRSVPKYFVQQIANVNAPQKPPLEPLRGMQLAKRSRLVGVPRGQDKNVAMGYRILLRQSLNGASAFLVPDTAAAAVGAQTHPDPELERPVGFARADLTPGHALSLAVMYTPAGETQLAQPGGGAFDWNTGGKGGRVRVRITWTAQDATTITTEHTLALEPSGEADAAAGSIWANIRRGRIPLMTPGAVNTPENAARWSAHTNVLIELYHIGGARIIDAIVHETPYWVGREEADAANLWTSHLYGAGHPDGPPATGTDYAWSSVASRLVDVAQAQGLRLGPQLISWTAWNDTDAALDDTLSSVTFSSGTFARLTDAASTTYSASEPGWSIDAAAYASDAAECDPYYDGRSVPVLVAVYAATDAGTTGLVRVQASASSWVDVTIADDTTPGWHLAYGHLTTSEGPGDPSVVQAFARRASGAGSFGVSAMSVYRMGQYSPAA